ncbi:DUF5818 domain-containing protein [Sphingomonas sp.]|uniref:DUF5818 domain-containing protein n=1 Tax=Sphingomonas sp. TaxID=28214 RepID=UPI002DEE045D|nr:DUF5818 domain-containing protein [Sphingomonas sp.]
MVLRDWPRIILRVDDGGEWQLDLRLRHGLPLGRRVRVRGKRSDFNIIDVDELKLL